MKVKSFIIIFLVLLILLGNQVFSDDMEENEELDNEVLSVFSTSMEELETFSKYIICIERTTGEVLYEKNAYEQTPMASTTKIMTAIIAIENSNLSDEVEISSKSAGTGGSTLGITSGDKMTMESLLYGLLLRSGNDCAVAIAEYIGGDVQGFAKLMNGKAKELGLNNTNFVTPHGLDSDEHYTTAYDLAVLTNYALNNEIFARIVGTKEISIMVGNSSRSMNNTNELLGNVEGIYGVKTGFTGNAGRCLVTACKRNNLDVIVVVLGADTKKIRGLDTKNVIEYVFNNFEMIDTKKIIDDGFKEFNKYQSIEVYKSEKILTLSYIDKESYIYPIDKNKINDLKTKIYCISKISAPVNVNTKVGNIRLINGDRILYSLDIVTCEDINKTTWQEYFRIFLFNYKKYYKI